MLAISAPQSYGFGYQFMRCLMACEDEPDYIIGGGDMNGIRLSDTMGRYLVPCRERRAALLRLQLGVRSTRATTATCSRSATWSWSGANNAGSSPLRRLALDRLRHDLDAAQQMDDAESATSSTSRLFAYDPATRALPPCSAGSVLMQRIRPQGRSGTGAQLWASNDGGATWAKLGPEMAATQFGGGMHILRHHPTDDTLLLGGQNGLWKSNPAKTSWSRPFNAGGLPTTRCTALEIDPANGNHMYAFMFDGAVWRTTNGGSSWVDSYSAVAVKRGCVDWRSPEPVVFVQLNRSVSAGFTLVRSTGPGGTDYQPPRSITGGFGWKSNDAYHNVALSKKTTAPGFEAIITPAAGVCLINASARMKRSEDGGATFQDTSVGFTGVGFVAYTPSVVVQRADNPDCIAIPVQDTNLLVTTDGFRSLDVRQIHIDPTVFGFPPSGVRSSYCLEWLPADAQNPNGVSSSGSGTPTWQGGVPQHRYRPYVDRHHLGRRPVPAAH